MAERLPLSSAGLLYGKPGVDAAAASDADLLFDSNAAPYSGCYLVGHISATDPGWVQTQSTVAGVTTTVRTYTLPFGRTFPAPPFVLAGVLDPAFTPPQFTSNYNVDTLISASTPTGQAGCQTGLTTNVTDTQVQFVLVKIDYTGGLQASIVVDVSYAIFEI